MSLGPRLQYNPLAIGADRTCGACPTARPPTATFLLRNFCNRGIPTLIHILGECHAGGDQIFGPAHTSTRALLFSIELVKRREQQRHVPERSQRPRSQERRARGLT